jgi:hypothetical protein
MPDPIGRHHPRLTDRRQTGAGHRESDETMRMRNRTNSTRRGFRGVWRTIAVVALAGATLGFGVGGASAASAPSFSQPTCEWLQP